MYPEVGHVVVLLEGRRAHIIEVVDTNPPALMPYVKLQCGEFLLFLEIDPTEEDGVWKENDKVSLGEKENA